jgi:hypothetical protein
LLSLRSDVTAKTALAARTDRARRALLVPLEELFAVTAVVPAINDAQCARFVIDASPNDVPVQRGEKRHTAREKHSGDSAYKKRAASRSHTSPPVVCKCFNSAQLRVARRKTAH